MTANPGAGAPTPALIEPLREQFGHLPADWSQLLQAFTQGPHYAALCEFVDGERDAGKIIYPHDVFRALHLTTPAQTKVVVLGQDPYYGEERGIPQAHGLAFSVPVGVRPPPSLRSIFKEIHRSLAHPMPTHGCLDHWASQGVLLLNSVLTVEQKRPTSHAKRGWEHCTDTLIANLSQQRRGLIFMLWGAYAQGKRSLIDTRHHVVLETTHPSPLSAHRGFLGCDHFLLANQALKDDGQKPIDWRLPEAS